MITSIFDLTANQSISCTVGTSAKPAFNSTNVWNAVKSGITTIESGGSLVTTSFAELSNGVLAGTSGVIYLEYLG